MPLEIVTLTLGPAQTNAYLVADSDTREAAVIDPAWDGKLILAEAQSRGWRIAHLWYTHAHFDHIGGAAEIADASEGALPIAALHPDDHVLWRSGGGGAFFGFDIDPGPEPTIDLHQGQLLRLGNVQFEVRFTPGHTLGHCVFYVSNPRAERSEPIGERSRSATDERSRSATDERSRSATGERSRSATGERSRSATGERSRSATDERSRSATDGLSRSAIAGENSGICFCGDLIFQNSVGRTDLPGGDWDALVNSIKTQIFTLPDETRLLSGHGPQSTVGREKQFNPFVGEGG